MSYCGGNADLRRHSGPQGRGRFIAVRLHGAQAPGPQRCERCLPLQCTDHAECWDSRREGATSELGVLPAARLRRAVPTRGRPSPPGGGSRAAVTILHLRRSASTPFRDGRGVQEDPIVRVSPGGGSQPSPRFFSVGDTRSARLRRADGSGSRRRWNGGPRDEVCPDQRFDTGDPLFDAGHAVGELADLLLHLHPEATDGVKRSSSCWEHRSRCGTTVVRPCVRAGFRRGWRTSTSRSNPRADRRCTAGLPPAAGERGVPGSAGGGEDPPGDQPGDPGGGAGPAGFEAH